MKKIISIILICTFILVIAPLNVVAENSNSSATIDISKYANEELDLTQYTYDDIACMTIQEYIALVRDFERVYDPYGSYSFESSVCDSISTNSDVVSPLWTSGTVEDGEWVEVGCHEIITATACSILINDKGFYSKTAAEPLAISLLISLASILPDKDERGSFPWYFAGHFYDPDTGMNYRNDTTDTAKFHAESHYYAAVAAAYRGDTDSAYEYLGRCLHYIQDMSVPHHAANITGLNRSHTSFENYVHENAETFLKDYTSLPNSYYTTTLNSNISSLAHNAAVFAKPKASLVDNVLNKSNWNTVGKQCIQSAVKYSVMVMYKFSTAQGVPFYPN